MTEVLLAGAIALISATMILAGMRLQTLMRRLRIQLTAKTETDLAFYRLMGERLDEIERRLKAVKGSA